MLVLSRKQKQQIKIGDQIEVTVLQIKGGSVRIGIEAPREIHVMRGELTEFQPPHPEESVEPVRCGRGDSAASKPSNLQREQSSSARILELKILGGREDDSAAPTRLTEIANSIASLNLPR